MDVAPDKIEIRLVRTAYFSEIPLTYLQGLWTVEQYVKIADVTNHLIEFTDGVLELLPMVTATHQGILGFLLRSFSDWMEPRGGEVLFAGLPLRISTDKFREPDLLLLQDSRDPRRQNEYWHGADLVLEVVSPDSLERDIVMKRADYAEGCIPEYWIVNPLDETITVLTLRGAAYDEQGVFHRGEVANSVLLPGFSVGVADVFDED